MPRAGFTLAEVLVAIGIFAVASAIMLGALFGATEVFRRGQAARQAGDEATAVLAALHDDLARALPVRLVDGRPDPAGGWLYAARRDDAGNCLLAFACQAPPGDALADGSAADAGPRLVAWWVEGETLRRAVYLPAQREAARRADAEAALVVQEVAQGCLHFGVWLSVPAGRHHPAFRRPLAAGGPDWEAREDPGDPAALSLLPPWGAASPLAERPDSAFDTDPAGSDPARRFFAAPEALRVSLVLASGSRYAARGRLVGDLDAEADALRLAGLTALPTVAGSLLRIGDEWLRYQDARGGRLTGLQRGQLRSRPAAHAHGSEARLGQAYSLVVAFPR